MAFYGYGYHYPRARRKTTVEYGDDYWQDWARAAILNRRVSKNNDWINFLKSQGVYDTIRNELRKASELYRAQKGISVGRKKSLEKELEKLRRAKEKVGAFGETIMKQYQASPEDVAAVVQKLQSQIDRINNILGTVPAKKGSGYGYF
ncbi:MAG: hypothetical protein NZZ41_08245, partial [Candidatus Dojkabacteria bacterium]|nr:hypothetical protein [Candidatus Dojkabacteria bacterium]